MYNESQVKATGTAGNCLTGSGSKEVRQSSNSLALTNSPNLPVYLWKKLLPTWWIKTEKTSAIQIKSSTFT